jgi:hypothetical protein
MTFMGAPPGQPIDHVGAASRASLRWHGWRFASTIYLVTIGLCFFATFVIPGLLGDHIWLPLGDGPSTIRSAEWVSWGGLGTVYSATGTFLPLPGYLLILVPFVALGDHYGLSNPYPFGIAHPSMLLVAAPGFFLTGATAILGVDYLADTLEIPTARRRALAIATGVFVVLPVTVLAGHPEDLLGIALSCLSLAVFLRGRYLGAALLLSSAILMQTWAGLLIPILVAASPHGHRWRTLVWSTVLPAGTAVLLLISDFQDSFRSLVAQPMIGYGQHLPWWGLAHRIWIPVYGGMESARVGSATRSLAVVAALIAAAIVWRRPTTLRIMSAVALVLLARAASETQLWTYYVAPAAVLMVIASALPGMSRRRWALGCASAVAAYTCALDADLAHFFHGVSPSALPPFVALAVLLVAGVGVAWATRDQRTADVTPRLLQGELGSGTGSGGPGARSDYLFVPAEEMA